MSSKHRISPEAATGLRQIIQRASGLDKRTFGREIGRKAEAYALQIWETVNCKDKKEDEEAKKYVLPAGVNVEQHLFNLTFANPDKPVKLINYVFCEYVPDGGYWSGISEDQMKQRILAIAEKAKYPDTKHKKGLNLGTTNNVDKTLAYAAIKLWHNCSEVSNKDLLAFRNGTVSIKTGKLSEHSPQNYLTFGLPYDYTENAECPPAMRQFIETSYGAGQIEYIRAAIGLMLDLNAPDKCIHAVGPSGSGKGTFCDLIRAMFSEDSVSAPTNFLAWNNPDLAQQQLAGKRLFVIDDLLGPVGPEIGGFHSGVEQKNINCRVLWAKQSYSRAMEMRAIFASTGPMKTSYSNSHGMKRRTFPLPTLKEISDPDRTLKTRLQAELGEIISWALSMDKTQRDQIIEHPEHYNDLAAEYFVESACNASSTWSFLETCVDVSDPHPTDTLSTQTVDVGRLYNCYRAYCAAVNKSALSLNNFKGEVRQAVPYCYIPQRKSKTVPARFVYLEVRQEIFDESSAGTIICNISKLKSDGINLLKEWTKKWGPLHPYTPGSIPTVTHKSDCNENATKNVTEGKDSLHVSNGTLICNETVTSNVSQDTKQAFGVGGTGGADPYFAPASACGVAGPKPAAPHTPLSSDKKGGALPAPPAPGKTGENVQPQTVTQANSFDSDVEVEELF